MSARTTLLTLVVLSCIFTGPAFGDGTREERTAELRKAVFEEVGGLDERFPTDFNDTDFCLKLLERGYRNVWTPDACLIHHESRTRGAPTTPEKRERYRLDTTAFLAKWRHRIEAGDPYFSPHFRLDRKAYVLHGAGETECVES